MVVRYSLILFVTPIIFLILSKNSHRRIWILNFLFCIALSIIAYHLVPIKSLDIYRYYSQIESAMKIGPSFIFNNVDYIALPVAGLYISSFVFLGNKFLLPAVTCFIYYYFVTNNMIEYSAFSKTNKKGLALALILFYSVSNYLGVISGIRNPMAISLFCYFLYKDIIMDRGIKKYIIPYILLCLFHSSIVILLIIRILLLLDKKRDRIICLILLLWSLVKTNIIAILINSTGNGFILMLSQKLIAYDPNEARSVANVSLYTFIYLLFYISSILIFILKNNMKGRKDNNGCISLNRYYKFLLCFCIGSIFEYHIFVRFSRSILILGSFYIMDITSNKQYSYKTKMLITTLILIEAMAFLLFYTTGQYTSIRLN